MSLLSQASLVVVPSGYKEDVVYSVKPTDGSGDLTFTRASDGTRVNSQGLVERVPWNLLQYSEDFSNAAWGKNNITLTAGQTDPNGGTTATTIDPTNTTSAYIRQNATITIGNKYTWSIYIKGSTTGQNIALYTEGASNVYEVKALSTSWQRFNIIATATSTGSSSFYILCGSGYSMTDLPFDIAFAQVNEGSTAKPYFPTTDRLNVPRLDYSGGCPSLLLEPQRTNLFTYSEQFDNSDWGKTNVTISANATTSPDGTQNADTFTPTTANGVHRIEQDKATASQVFTQSIFAKANGYNFIALENGGEIAYFNLSTGVVGTVSAGTASIQNMGNGWYRCIFTATALNSKSYFYAASVDNSISFAGNGTSGIYVWGAQFEAGSYPTSYIPTTSASVTRVADAASKTGISSLIGQTAGSFYFEYTPNDVSVSTAQDYIPFAISDGTSSNAIFFNDYNGNITLIINNGGSIQTTISYGGLVAGQTFKIAAAYNTNDVVLYINGSQIGTDTSATIPATSKLSLNGFTSLVHIGSVNINQAVLFKTRLTNAELAALTTL